MRDWAEELVPSKDKVAPEESNGAQRDQPRTFCRPLWLTECEHGSERHDGDDEAVGDDRDDEMGLAGANRRDDGADEEDQEEGKQEEKDKHVRRSDVHQRIEKVSDVREMREQERHESEDEHERSNADQENVSQQRKEDGQLKQCVCWKH